METKNNSRAYKKAGRVNTEIFITFQDVTAHLLLYFFIALEWITGPLRNKENRYTTGIGLS